MDTGPDLHFDDLADEFALYERAHNNEIDDVDDMANELLGNDPAFSSGVGGSDGEIGRIQAPSVDDYNQMVQATDQISFFGLQSFLSNLGSEIQRKLMQRVWDGLKKTPRKRKASNPETVPEAVLQNYAFKSTNSSVAAVAESTGFSETSVAATVESIAAIMLYGGNWLVAGFCATLRRMVQSGRMIPVLHISKMKYDETPLRLRISEWSQFFGTTERSFLATAGGSTSDQEYRFAKVFRVHWTLGDLTAPVRVEHLQNTSSWFYVTTCFFIVSFFASWSKSGLGI